MPQDIRGAVCKPFRFPGHFLALMEKVLDARGPVRFPVPVWEEYICIRIYAAGNPVVFPACIHKPVFDRNAPVLVPFGVCNVHRVMDEVKILPRSLYHIQRVVKETGA